MDADSSVPVKPEAVVPETSEQVPVKPDSPDIVKSEIIEDQQADVEMKELEVMTESPEIKTESPEIDEQVKPEAEVKAEDSDSPAKIDRSLDGSSVDDLAPSFVAPAKLMGASIRINLTSQLESGKLLESRESAVSNSSDVDQSAVQLPEVNPDLDPDCIIQPRKHENAEPKPKLVGRKFAEMPPQNKGEDTSGLCSIMWTIPNLIVIRNENDLALQNFIWKLWISTDIFDKSTIIYIQKNTIRC